MDELQSARLVGRLHSPAARSRGCGSFPPTSSILSVATSQSQLPIRAIFCAAASCASLCRSSSSARLRSAISACKRIVGDLQVRGLLPQRAADAARDEGDEAERREQRAHAATSRLAPAELVGLDALLEQGVHLLIGDPPELETGLARQAAGGQILVRRDVHFCQHSRACSVSWMNSRRRFRCNPSSAGGTRLCKAGADPVEVRIFVQRGLHAALDAVEIGFLAAAWRRSANCWRSAAEITACFSTASPCAMTAASRSCVCGSARSVASIR